MSEDGWTNRKVVDAVADGLRSGFKATGLSAVPRKKGTYLFDGATVDGTTLFVWLQPDRHSHPERGHRFRVNVCAGADPVPGTGNQAGLSWIVGAGDERNELVVRNNIFTAIALRAVPVGQETAYAAPRYLPLDLPENSYSDVWLTAWTSAHIDSWVDYLLRVVPRVMRRATEAAQPRGGNALVLPQGKQTSPNQSMTLEEIEARVCGVLFFAEAKRLGTGLEQERVVREHLADLVAVDAVGLEAESTRFTALVFREMELAAERWSLSDRD